MSDDTRAALEAAIRAHILDEYDEPQIVTDYAVLVASQGLDDTVTGYFYVCPIGMAAHVLTGLLGHFLRLFEHRHTPQDDTDD